MDIRILDELDKEEIDKEIDSLKKSGVESNKILVDVLNSKEVQASTEDTIKVNVGKVNKIETGSKVPLLPTDDLIAYQHRRTGIRLKWSSPQDIYANNVLVSEFKEDILVKNTTSYPTSIDDGIVMGRFARDKHKTEFYLDDKDLEFDTTYYYSVFSVSTNKTIVKNGTARATFKEVFAIKELPIGAKIKHPEMKYDNKELVFMKVTEDGHYKTNETIFMTEGIIRRRAFDAKEPKNSNSARRDYGNNDYEVSNIDQWLNSNQKDWYKPQHSADQAPTSSYVNDNPYADESGFLTNFSTEVLENIPTTEIKSGKYSIVGGGIVTLRRKIFLASSTEIGLGDEFSSPEGKPFPYFTSNAKREAGTRYWLRSPRTDYAQSVRIVDFYGSRYFYSAWRSEYGGVRPALSLSSSLLVSLEPNSDGVYELYL